MFLQVKTIQPGESDIEDQAIWNEDRWPRQKLGGGNKSLNVPASFPKKRFYCKRRKLAETFAKSAWRKLESSKATTLNEGYQFVGIRRYLCVLAPCLNDFFSQYV